MPFIKKKVVDLKRDASPLLEESGKSVIKKTSLVATDVLEGKNLKESSKKRFEEFDQNLSEIGARAGKQQGGGLKSSFNTPIKRHASMKKKKKRDIFDLK